MSVRKFVLVALALVVAGGTVQISRTLLQRAAPPPALVTAPEAIAKTTRVLVAATALPAGTLIQPTHLQWRAWPEEAGQETVYAVEGLRPAEYFHGAVLRHGLRAGEPLVDGTVVRPGDRGFLAAVLTPGTRAVSVAINGVTGIAGFVFPGDRVDVLMTHLIRNADGGSERRASETVLADIRVLALDQRHDDQKAEVKEARIATIEVTPDQAERVALAAEMGQLSLSLRAVSGPEPTGVEVVSADGLTAVATDASGLGPVRAGQTITWDSDLSLALLRSTAASAVPIEALESQPGMNATTAVKVQVVRGGDSAEVSFQPR